MWEWVGVLGLDDVFGMGVYGLGWLFVVCFCVSFVWIG